MKEDHVTRVRQKVISLLASFLMVISLFPTNTVLAQEQDIKLKKNDFALTEVRSIGPTTDGDFLSNSLDGNPNTYTNSAYGSVDAVELAHPQIYTFTLREKMNISKVGVQARSEYHLTQLDHFSVYLSSDKNDWQPVASNVSVTSADMIYAEFEATPALYVKIDLYADEGVNCVSTSEVEIYRTETDQEETPTVDKTDLKAAIDKADALEQGNFTDSSWKVLESALKEAKKVYDDADATEEEVAKALDIINDALDSLYDPTKDQNKTALSARIDEVNAIIIAADRVPGLYPGDLNALKSVLSKAQDVLNDSEATKEKIDNVAKELEQALNDFVNGPAVEETITVKITGTSNKVESSKTYSADSLEEAVNQAIDEGVITNANFVTGLTFESGVVTDDDLRYIKNKFAEKSNSVVNGFQTLVIDLDNDLVYLDDEVETTVFPDSALKGFSALRDVSLAGWTVLDEQSFYGTDSLEKLNIPNVERLEYNAIAHSGIVSVDLPSVTYIGKSAFSSSDKLETVNMPKVEELASAPFYGCEKLTNITIPSTVKKLDATRFGYYTDEVVNITFEGNEIPQMSGTIIDPYKDDSIVIVTIPKSGISNYLETDKTILTEDDLPTWLNGAELRVAGAYKLTFKVDGEIDHFTFQTEDVLQAEQMYEPSTIPEGQIFNGWYTEDGVKIDAGSQLSDDTVVSAKFVSSVDKSKLQALYDEVKDYQSDNDYFKYFTQQLTNTKEILDDPDATQEKVDRQYNWLNAKYYALLVSELNAKYDPENVDLTKYTTESLIPVINMWGITHGKTVPAYQENEASGNVGQMQGWHEQYLEAEKGLKLADDTTEWIGIFGEAATKQEINQGHFEVVKEEVVNVDGEDKLQLTVRFINDGLHPIYGKELGSKEFKKFTSLRNCSIKVEAYDADMVSKMSSGLTNITETEDGVEGTYIVDEGYEYLTFSITASGKDDPSISAGYYRIPEMSVPFVTVVGVLEDDGKHVRLEINGPLSSSSNAITTPQESNFTDKNGFKYEFYEGKHTIVTDSYRQQDFDRVALISAESKTTVNCLYYDENGDLQFYSYHRGDGMQGGSAPTFTVTGKKGASNVNVDVTDRGILVPDAYGEVIKVDGNPNQTVLTITGVDLCTNNTGGATAVDKLELVKRDENGKEEYRIEGTISRDHKTITFVIENEDTGAAESGVYYTEPAILSGTYFFSHNVGPYFRTCFELNVSKLSNALYYDANGGEGGPSSNYTNGKNITIQSETPTREGYEFVGWNTKMDGTGTTYQPKDEIVIDENEIGGQKVTLYAMWQKVITLTPEEDLTGYTGGDSLNDTSFPNMRYTISLPEGVDASSGIILHYTNSKGEEGTTTIGNYQQGLSLLAEGEDANITEQPVLIPELEPSYKLNDKEVKDDSEPGVYDFEVKNDKDLYAEIKGENYKVNVDDEDTTITVRYVSDPERMSDANTDYINDVVNVAPTTEVEEATAVTDPNTTYLTNDKENIAVMNEDAVGLLVDELLSDNDGFDREKAMLEKLNGFLDEKDLQTVSEGNYDFMYLDLVNTLDGNAWVSSTNGTDIYLPYPEGTDENTKFNVVHFPGLHREYGFEGEVQVGDAIKNCNPELVSIENTAQGIKFHIGKSGFSPFALTWSDSTTEFDVSYVFKSEDGRVLPQEVNALLPTAQTATEGSTVSPQALTTTSITTTEGVWTFKGWDQQSVTVSQDVVFTGTWSFTANPSQPVFDLSDMNTTIEQGSKFDPLAGIHATDAQGNDITGSIKVVTNNVNTSKPGKYTVTYEVTDQYGNISQVTVEFTVKAKESGGSETANKDDLKDLIDKADKLDADKYTKDSWNALEKALEQAKNVYKDPSATAEEINSAYNALNNAMKNLKKVSEKGKDANTAAQMNAALYGGIAIVALGAMLICIRKRSKKS
ncbi:SHIRT domain-containing protein [Faecalicoccus acidiformans]|uniref:SHIRT domain-containing protein n=1 Tax=Faecalicoccus acidiformans TaxID=915173 RepID=UPI00320A4C49